MKAKEIIQQCYSCVFRCELSWSCHSKCTAEWVEFSEMPKGNDYGRSEGWYHFPVNYDPVWMEEESSKYHKK